jgi:hypothetical protein
VSQGGTLLDQSVLQPLSTNVLKTVLTAVKSTYTLYAGSTFSYQNAFRLHFAGALDIGDALSVLTAKPILDQWTSYFGKLISLLDYMES